MPSVPERSEMKLNNGIEEPIPDIYVCPISRSLMHDPVAIAETGQIFDRFYISEWFKSGHNMCPLSGVTLASQKLIPLPALSTCIGDWAAKHGVVFEPLEMQLSKGEDEGFKELDNPCRSASLVSSERVSVYDAAGVAGLLNTRQPVALQYAAMVVLRELILHSDEQKLERQIMPYVDIDRIKYLLKNEYLQVPATRLLLTMKGALDMNELLESLNIPNADLQLELLSRLVDHLCYPRRPSAPPRTGCFRSMVNSVLGRFRRTNCGPSPSSLFRRS